MASKIIKIVSIILCLFWIIYIVPFSVIAEVEPPVIEEWVARYNGPCNGSDNIRASTVDHSGNIYVTGESYSDSTVYDFATIAYSPSGRELWVARYDGSGTGVDSANDIVVSPIGIIFVTGHSMGVKSGYDLVTIAYDLDGNELWVARYNGPGNDRDIGGALTTDSKGNVYVTGWSYGRGTDYDYVTLTYNSTGNLLWLKRYNGPINGYDKPYDIALDSSGKIYVTGMSEGVGSGDDYCTIAYDNNGQQLWVARYDGPGNNIDRACELVIDCFGNIVVTGDSWGNGTYSDYATVAYDSLGNELWSARYNGLGNYWDIATAIVSDSFGNVYVTGKAFYNLTGFDYTTIAYDRLGNELWITRYDGGGNGWDMAFDLTLDLNGNVIVTGRGYINSGFDFITIAYDPAGSELWLVRYNGLASDFDYAYFLCSDSFGNIYVSGVSVGIGTSHDYAIVKYSFKTNFVPTNNINPDSLNLRYKGRWITAYVALPKGYNLNDIDISTILLYDTIPAQWGDMQEDTLIIKFDRSEVEDMIGEPCVEVELTITGEFYDGTPFTGSDIITVIEPSQ
jgi:hypothetical protein